MAHPHTFYRTLAALILLGALAAVCVSLGNWQLGRAAQRDAIKAAIDSGRSQAPVSLHGDTPAEALIPWRPAQATGIWRPELTVLLQNRNHQGRPGYWVATPLMLHDASSTAVLVLRGWLPREAALGASQAALPDIPEVHGQATVAGELLEHVPRLLELWSWSDDGVGHLPARIPDAEGGIPVVQNLPISAYATATGLKFMPTILAQTGPASGSASQNDPLVREWPEPALDSDKNRGYALQWFGFATIAAIAWLIVLWRAIRRRISASKTL